MLSVNQIKLKWLILHRYLAIAGVLLLVFVCELWLHLQLPLGPMGVATAFLMGTNLIAHGALWRRLEIDLRLVGAILVFDTAILTTILHQSGGASNPFSIFYLVHIVLAGFLLSATWAWVLAFVCILSFGSLFFLPSASPHLHHMGHAGSEFSWHLRGMWLSFSLAALLVAYLTSGLVLALRRKETELERVRERARRHEQIVSLASIAAGAAHELNTPLSTIAIVAKELEEEIMHQSPRQEVLADLALIRSQIDRCKGVLNLLSDQSMERLSGETQTRTLADFIEHLHEEFRLLAKQVLFRNETGREVSLFHVRKLETVLKNLIQNALDASQDREVNIRVCSQPGKIEFSIEDSGEGFSHEELEKVYEPFYTTKDQGMGLGLFLTRHLVEELGGSLVFESQLGKGTIAKLAIPMGEA